ncbi:hypothetical protein, partial [Actinomyces sp.]|uniref:hypothetical protein n=1 Tax=Actinomyces sp. TaxID=29317 RepID=UPI0026DA9C21
MTSQTPPPSAASAPGEPTKQNGRRGLTRRQVIGGLSTAVVLTGAGVRIWMRIPAPEPDTTPFSDYFSGRTPVMSEPNVNTKKESRKSWGLRIFLSLEQNTPVDDAITLIQSAHNDLAESVKGLEYATLIIGWNGAGPAGEDLHTSINVDLVRPRSELDFQCERLRIATGLNQGSIGAVGIPLETDEAISIGHVQTDTLPADVVLAPPATADGTVLTYEDDLESGGTSLKISASSDVDLSVVPLDAVLAALPSGTEDPTREPRVRLDAVGPGYADRLPAIEIYARVSSPGFCRGCFIWRRGLP